MNKARTILAAALIGVPSAMALYDETNDYASPQSESSYQPSVSWEETQVRIKVLVLEGYNVCATFNLDYNSDLGLKKEHCFQFEEADKLKHSGVSPKEANPLADSYSSSTILKLREDGCNLTKLPDILKQSEQATRDHYEAGYLAESVCQGKRKVKDIYKYGPRFRGYARGDLIIEELDEAGITTAEEAECFSLALSSSQVVEFGKAKVSCKQERAYASLVGKRKLTIYHNQRQNDCFDVLGAIKLEILPETAEWYFQLRDHNPELDINYCDMSNLEKRVAGGRATKEEIKTWASEENERLRRERVKEALR